MSRYHPIPPNEHERLAALNEYGVVGTPPEPEFDHVAKLAAEIFDVPTALISFVEKDRQTFKARIGFEASETSRDASFCAHTIVKNDVMVIPDAMNDDRFRNNPLVTAAPSIRFYAGAPLTTSDGHNIGSICIIDSKPRAPLSLEQIQNLKRLAQVTMDHLERRRFNDLKKAAFSFAAATLDGLVGIDAQRRITFWNPAAAAMFGYTRREVTGQPVERLIPVESLSSFLKLLEPGEGARSSHQQPVELLALKNDGMKLPIELSVARWEEDGQAHHGLILRDVSQRHLMQEHLRYLTSFDRLTDLPNRSRFLEEIDEALRAGSPFFILKIGLDKLGEINGTMGMAAGDRVLKQTAERIGKAAGRQVLVARLGGDEFGILARAGDFNSMAIAVLRCFAQPFLVSGLVAHVGASIGAVQCSEDQGFDDANAVLKAALLALHEAKSRGGGVFELFRPEMGRKADEQRRIAEDLHRAFAAGEFELFFQPQVDLHTRAIVGAEALLRWRHPERGLLPPAAFLPVLELSNIAVDVGRWIIRSACSFAADFVEKGIELQVGVNLFAAQLRDGSLENDISKALSESGLPPHMLELEITETTVLGLEDDVVAPLRAIRSTGIGIAFDDYGTGFASLSLLKKYPLTRLKIDREFVRDIEDDPDDAAIVGAVLALGESLKLEMIAEGMETEAQADILKRLGCKRAQGYFFGKPMPADEFRMKILQTAKGLQ
ncbi:MAG: EAL domain-containing protein [Rhizobium sp.]